MKYLVGFPPGLQRLGEFTYRYRGQVDFQIDRHGGMWWCHSGYSPPTNLSSRAFDRRMGWEPERFHSLISVQHEAGWGSLTRNGVLRKVCRSIEKELAKVARDDQRYLEAKGTGARI